MGGILGGGAPAGSSGTGTGSIANVYTPMAQPQFDQYYQNIIRNLMGQGYGPAGTYYPVAQNVLSNNFLQNPYLPMAREGAVDASAMGQQGARQLFGAGDTLLGAGRTALNTAFDPQSALYNRTLQQLSDQQSAVNAMSGVAGTPYGAGVTGQTLSNFGIDWQNQLLNRQLAGLQGYGGATQGAGGAFGTGLGLQLGASSAPYQTMLGAGQSDLGALANVINIGQQRYQLPQQVINDLQSYLQLGQSASSISGQLGQMGFNQGMQSAMGLGSLGLLGTSALFGNPLANVGAFPSGGLLGGSLFGGGAGAGAGAAGLAPFAPAGSAAASGGDILGLSGQFPGAAGLIPSGGGPVGGLTPLLGSGP